MYLADSLAGDLIIAAYEIQMQRLTLHGDDATAEALQAQYLAGSYHDKAEAAILAAQRPEQLPAYLLAAWHHLTAGEEIHALTFELTEANGAASLHTLFTIDQAEESDERRTAEALRHLRPGATVAAIDASSYPSTADTAPDHSPRPAYCTTCAGIMRNDHQQAPGMAMHAAPCGICGTRANGPRYTFQ